MTGNGRARVKSIEQSIADTEERGTKLRKELGALDLVVFGVAVAIGAGIFTLTARVAGDIAGPSVALGFVLAAIGCGLAALCYAEFASTVPVAGSAYTFSYATFGELAAWVIGWDLMLEFGFAAATVAKGWSLYLAQFLSLIGLKIDSASFSLGAVTFDWGALLIVGALTAVLVFGVKLSSRLSQVITAIKILVVLLVLVVGFGYIKASNYSPYIPPAAPAAAGGADTGFSWSQSLVSLVGGSTNSHFGIYGLLAAASLVFFAFIGFDVVATTAEETRNPQRDIPWGIIGSLVVITVLYVAVSTVLTGMVNYTQLASKSASEHATLATAFELNGVGWAATIISLGALAGLTTVVLVLLLGQTRVLFAMSRDGLLPRSLAHTGSRGTPTRITMIVGVISALIAGFVPTSSLEEMVNIGTLAAFVMVSVGVMVLRKTRPDLPRAFRTPLVPLVPILSVLACLWLMLNLTVETWLRFIVWMAIGFIVYYAYSRKHSRFATGEWEVEPVGKHRS
ncbi:amino acid permease [Pseudonocardia spinosispora]|uniref:amino acid permease n=1 Tax=Pseudonocardia spinosispora TaxID=103441 RepID=UPI0006888985|nr:amino acid permease [Pseudonocardia spinosispora]